jgi:hypothetical protein
MEPTEPPPVVEASPEAPARSPRYLSVGWRWALASGWATIMACLGIIANTGWILGSTPFWLPTFVLGFLAPAAVLLAVAADSKHTLRLSWLAVGVTAVLGLIDLLDARAMGVAELVLALVGALITLAASSGRVDPAGSASTAAAAA